MSQQFEGIKKGDVVCIIPVCQPSWLLSFTGIVVDSNRNERIVVFVENDEMNYKFDRSTGLLASGHMAGLIKISLPASQFPLPQ